MENIRFLQGLGRKVRVYIWGSLLLEGKKGEKWWGGEGGSGGELNNQLYNGSPKLGLMVVVGEYKIPVCWLIAPSRNLRARQPRIAERSAHGIELGVLKRQSHEIT